MKLNETPLRSITRYEGVVIDVRLDLAKLPDGSTALREVVEHPGGVAVLPLEADGTVWCVRQFRYPFGEQLLEIPAGRLEPCEAPEGPASGRGASRPRRVPECGNAHARRARRARAHGSSPGRENRRRRFEDKAADSCRF